MAEATDGGLKSLVRVSVKPFDHQLLGRKSASLWVAAVLWLPLGSAERVGRPGLLASESLGWLSNFFTRNIVI